MNHHGTHRLASLACLGLIVAPLASGCHSSGAALQRGPEFRQFDFWLGRWEVHTPDGKLAGVNRIEREYGGCVVHEHYDTGKGYTGESLNIYDAARKVWHQSWVDSSGTLLLLDGRFVGWQHGARRHAPRQRWQAEPAAHHLDTQCRWQRPAALGVCRWVGQVVHPVRRSLHEEAIAGLARSASGRPHRTSVVR